MSKCLYFAYGSNLFGEKLRPICGYNAVVKDIGCIKDFRLDFQRYSKTYNGVSATIVQTENSVVWGVIWEIDCSGLESLEESEGVRDDICHVLSMNVETPNGTVLRCRVFQQCNNPKEYVKLADLPMNRRPLPLYLDLMLKGAQENNLPADYIELLKTIPHNGYEEDDDEKMSKFFPAWFEHKRFARACLKGD